MRASTGVTAAAGATPSQVKEALAPPEAGMGRTAAHSVRRVATILVNPGRTGAGLAVTPKTARQLALVGRVQAQVTMPMAPQRRLRGDRGCSGL